MPIDTAKINWGLRPFHEEAEAFFGCRMIFQHGQLSYLPGRGSEAGTDKNIDDLIAWVNSKGIPQLRKYIKSQGWTERSSDTFVLEDGEKRLEASPRASYGYMYISAYIMPKQEQEISI